VRKVGQVPELYEDARSEKYKQLHVLCSLISALQNEA